jgi:putative transposase
MTSPRPQGELTVERMCALSSVNRAGYYRHWKRSAPRQEETAVRDAMQRIALSNRRYGYRRIAAQLRRDGLVANHKRVLRLMRRDNLLCLRGHPFVPMTTDSQHEWHVVPNLARGLVPTGLDQLWVADITYIRLAEEFAFLAVVLDAFSRRVIGWALDLHLRADLATAALNMAIAARRPQPGSLIHHSDRGVQYACREYASLLEAHGIQPSMSRVGNPYDNAQAESFMKTLKQGRPTDATIGMSTTPATGSGRSSNRSTIVSDCTRRWPIGRRPSSKQACNSLRPPRGGRKLLRSQPVPSFVSHPKGALHTRVLVFLL